MTRELGSPAGDSITDYVDRERMIAFDRAACFLDRDNLGPVRSLAIRPERHPAPDPSLTPKVYFRVVAPHGLDDLSFERSSQQHASSVLWYAWQADDFFLLITRPDIERTAGVP
jgi:hypothetical protein